MRVISFIRQCAACSPSAVSAAKRRPVSPGVARIPGVCKHGFRRVAPNAPATERLRDSQKNWRTWATEFALTLGHDRSCLDSRTPVVARNHVQPLSPGLLAVHSHCLLRRRLRRYLPCSGEPPMSIFMHRIRSDRQLRGKSGLGKTNRSRTRRDARFGLDLLEDRRLLSNYMVTNTNYSGADSLGAAIAAAISSDDSHAQIDFVLPDNSTISLTASDKDPSSAYGPTAYVISGSGVNITIDGSGAPGLTISGSGAIRVFAVTSTASLTLEDLTVSGGLAQGFAGGAGGFSGAGGGGAGMGGAVYDDGGSFTADGVTFTNDMAAGGSGGKPD